MAQLSELRSRVRNNVGGRSDKNAIIDTIINNVVSDLARKYRFNDLLYTDSSKTLSNGTYSVTFPTTTRLIERVILKYTTSYYNVKVQDRATARDLYSSVVPTNSGVPADCFISGRTLYFDKLADQDYTVYLDTVIYPVDMSEEDDTPSIYGVDELIVALATSRLYMHLKQPQGAQEWYGLAQMIAQGLFDEVFGGVVDTLDPS